MKKKLLDSFICFPHALGCVVVRVCGHTVVPLSLISVKTTESNELSKTVGSSVNNFFFPFRLYFCFLFTESSTLLLFSFTALGP